MPYVRLPFGEMGQAEGAHSEGSCPVCSGISPELKEQAKEHHQKLSRKLGDIERPNIISPLGDATFAHIFPDPEDSRNHYIPIEPVVGQNCDALMEKVEDRLVGGGGKLPHPPP